VKAPCGDIILQDACVCVGRQDPSALQQTPKTFPPPPLTTGGLATLLTKAVKIPTKEKASIAMITPTIPQISALRAVETFPGSPLAVKNKKPATMNIKIAIPTNMGQIKPNMATIRGQTLFSPIALAGYCGKSRARTAIGTTNKTNDKRKATNFFFIFRNLTFMVD
jgi:hypothetical protein